MRPAGRAGTAGAVLLVLALGGACTAFAPPRRPAPVQASWPGCAAVGAFVDDRGQGPTGVGGVPAGFTPTTEVLCDQGERQTAAGDTVGVDLERTSTEVGPLLTYLAQPSKRTSSGACTADGWLPPWLFLVDASGHYVAPQIPVDGCGKPLGWYVDRDRLAWETSPYSDRVVREAPAGENSQARQSGCPTTHPDVVDGYATSPHRRSGVFTSDPFAGRSLRYCVYDVDASERGSVPSPGIFVSGYNLVEDERAGVVSALLSAAEVPEPCTESHSSFALVGPRDGGPSLFIELDGCRRVVSDLDPTPVVRAGDDLVSLLGG